MHYCQFPKATLSLTSFYPPTRVTHQWNLSSLQTAWKETTRGQMQKSTGCGEPISNRHLYNTIPVPKAQWELGKREGKDCKRQRASKSAVRLCPRNGRWIHVGLKRNDFLNKNWSMPKSIHMEHKRRELSHSPIPRQRTMGHKWLLGEGESASTKNEHTYWFSSAEGKVIYK